MNIREYFDRSLAKSPDRPLFQYREGGKVLSITYAEAAARLDELSALFKTLGLVPRSAPVAIILENSPMWIELYLALASSEIPVVPVDPKLQLGEVEYILRDSGVTTVFTDEKHLSMLGEMSPRLPALRNILTTNGFATPAPTPFTPSSPALASVTALPALESPIASIIYTSGTTGRPKGAIITHDNFIADATGALKLFPTIDERDSFFLILPLFHSFAFTGIFIVPIIVGATIQFGSSLRTIGEDIKAMGPSIIMAVPLMVEKLFERIQKNINKSPLARFLCKIGLRPIVAKQVRGNLGGRIRLLVVGGAPCSTKVIRGMHSLGIGLIEGYGLTEASPIVSVNCEKDMRVGTIGIPLPNIQVRLADIDAHGVGELQVRGPIVTAGYLNLPEATAETFEQDKDGGAPWLRTGDLASQDPDGYLTIRGRKKSLIVNREGKNIYPEEVEQCIGHDSHILDVVVVGYTDDPNDVGEKVGAIVVPNVDEFAADTPWETIEAKTREIVKAQCDNLAEYKRPRKLRVDREPLQRTSSQKIRRFLYQGTL